MKLNTVILLLSCLCVPPALANAKDTAASNSSIAFTAEAPDRQEELQKLFDQAAATGEPVKLTPGLYRHSGFLYLRGIRVSGADSKTIIEGTTRDHSAIIVTGSGAQLSHVKLTYHSTTRSLDIEASEVLVRNADKFEVSNIMIEGGDCAGILMSDAHHGVIRDNDIRSTLADSIHMTNGSSDIVVHDNTTHYSGDDGVAAVSYERDRKMVHDIDAFHNTIIDNKVARGMSVVGGYNVYYHDNYIKCAGEWAGIYIASEKVFETYGVHDVVMKDNVIKECGGHKLGHGAVTIFSDYNTNKNIVFEGNVVEDSKATGFHIIGKNNLDITLENNVILRTKDQPIYLEPEASSPNETGNTILNQ